MSIYGTDISSSIMPAGVLHWVLGTSNAICVGRHFYSTSMIRSTVITIVHTFLLGGALTNADYLHTRTLLYQLLVFWSMRIDKRDVDGKSKLNYCHILLIWTYHRAASTGHVFCRGVFRRVISRNIRHPLSSI
jgi:hypothetical protein